MSFWQRSSWPFAVVTKSDHVESLLGRLIKGIHRFRFSINTEEIINEHEEGTAPLEGRLDAAVRVHGAGYPLGFIVAPLIIYEGWQSGYTSMLDKLAASLPEAAMRDLTFELIMHRFTQRSRRLILERFPDTTLAMDTRDRIHKGFGKYVYEPQKAQELEGVLRSLISERFPEAQIEYFT